MVRPLYELCCLAPLGPASQAASRKIHGKIGYEAPVEETKQDEKQTENEQRYEDGVEINDFPQTARWKVTSKVIMEAYSLKVPTLNALEMLEWTL